MSSQWANCVINLRQLHTEASLRPCWQDWQMDYSASTSKRQKVRWRFQRSRMWLFFSVSTNKPVKTDWLYRWYKLLLVWYCADPQNCLQQLLGLQRGREVLVYFHKLSMETYRDSSPKTCNSPIYYAPLCECRLQWYFVIHVTVLEFYERK